jgi:hypothetical protein
LIESRQLVDPALKLFDLLALFSEQFGRGVRRSLVLLCLLDALLLKLPAPSLGATGLLPGLLGLLFLAVEEVVVARQELLLVVAVLLLQFLLVQRQRVVLCYVLLQLPAFQEVRLLVP